MRIRIVLLLAMCASCKRPPAHGAAKQVWLFATAGCAQLVDGRLACWGPGPPAIAPELPVRETHEGLMANLPKGVASGAVKQIAYGDGFGCALLSGGDVRCWGKNPDGELGDGTRNASEDVAVPVHGIEESTQIAVGRHHACALQKSGLVACWGKNDRHQLASGTTEPSSRPAPIVGLVGVRQIVAAANGTCALLSEGEVRCWGGNDDGLLGDARKPDHEVPVTVMLPK